jgi:hypothetical protein
VPDAAALSAQIKLLSRAASSYTLTKKNRTHLPLTPSCKDEIMPTLETTCIGIIGLGYVGLPLAVEFSKKLPTIGFDLNTGPC